MTGLAPFLWTVKGIKLQPFCLRNYYFALWMTMAPLLIAVVGSAKVDLEVTVKSKIKGEARRPAEAIADQLRVRFKEQGWIQ